MGPIAGDMKLVARDADDVAVIAAFVQDALVPVSEIRYLAGEQRFIMLLNRFRWERVAATDAVSGPVDDTADAGFHDADDIYGTNQRIHCGICVDGVTAVRSRGIDLRERSRFLSLLTMQFDGQNLNFVFSGDGTIQLTLADPGIFFRDMGEGWPTQWRPDHQLGKGSGAKERP